MQNQSPLIEKVAKALVEAFNSSRHFQGTVLRQGWDELTDERKAYGYEQATAAITAIFGEIPISENIMVFKHTTCLGGRIFEPGAYRVFQLDNSMMAPTGEERSSRAWYVGTDTLGSLDY